MSGCVRLQQRRYYRILDIRLKLISLVIAVLLGSSKKQYRKASARRSIFEACGLGSQGSLEFFHEKRGNFVVLTYDELTDDF